MTIADMLQEDEDLRRNRRYIPLYAEEFLKEHGLWDKFVEEAHKKCSHEQHNDVCD